MLTTKKQKKQPIDALNILIKVVIIGALASLVLLQFGCSTASSGDNEPEKTPYLKIGNQEKFQFPVDENTYSQQYGVEPAAQSILVQSEVNRNTTTTTIKMKDLGFNFDLEFIFRSKKTQIYIGFRLDDDYSTIDKLKEREANLFASNLLMNKELLVKTLKNISNITDEIIQSLAQTFNVSISAMTIRLSQLGYC